MNGLVEAPFGDGIHRFRLTIGGAEELEEKCGAGLGAIARRLATGDWRVRDVRETLRIGLVGGGLGPTAALVLLDRYASFGLEAHRATAVIIISKVLFGEEDDPPGKSEPGQDQSQASPGETNEQVLVPTTAPAL